MNDIQKKKSLGQHFLHAPHYLALIADTAGIVENEWVLEVGPGDGALTRALLKRKARVVAIEKDSRLIPKLKKKFAKEIKAKKFFLHEGDALEFSPADARIKTPYKVVANIPYYITGALIRKFLSEKNPPSSLVLLVQKEVALRIAREKKESILSLSVKAYGTPAYVKTVPRGAFVPPPKVDSAILHIQNVSRAHFKDAAAEVKFFTLVKAGFAQKRKVMKKNLEKVLGPSTTELFAKAGVPERARAEDVSLPQWLALSGLEGTRSDGLHAQTEEKSRGNKEKSRNKTGKRNIGNA